MSSEEKNIPTTAKVNYGKNDEWDETDKVSNNKQEMLFDNSNLLWIMIGLLIVVFGFVLMSGGQMPNADTFDKTIIYSARRITFAPILIIGGLLVVVYAIFKKSKV